MGDRPLVDVNKKRVFISLGIPMYNELIKGHLHETLNNAIAVGFDDIVVLDDGSTDGTWNVLEEYASTYKHIRIYKNEVNSVFYGGKNRWKFVVDRIAEKAPDWVVIRAADQIYSHRATIEGGDKFRKKLTDYYHQGIELVRLPLAHLWRSNTWYRADNVWGIDIRTHSKQPIWRFHPNYNYNKRLLTGAHLGWHHPNFFGFAHRRKLIQKNINTGKFKDWDLIILHLGHSTHNSKIIKFEWSMEAAIKNFDNGRSSTMPPPDKMPPVRMWLNNNHNNDGYKGFYEFNMVLKQANTIWFPDGFDFTEAKPIPESMYPIIKKYNKQRAEEYKTLYEQCYKSNIATIKPHKKHHNNNSDKFEGECK